MSWFTEDSTFPMVTGAMMVLVFIGFWVYSREKSMAYIALAIGLLTALTVTCEQLIVTEREEVTEVVYQLAFKVQTNDLAGVLRYVAPSQETTRQRVRREMPGYDFQTCQMIGVSDFQVIGDAPRTVAITFNVVVRAGLAGQAGMHSGRRRVQLTFEKDESGAWKVIDYEHWDPNSGLSV